MIDFLEIINPLYEKMMLLSPDENVVEGIAAVEAFGHSVGHLAYRIKSEDKTILLWGDITNHYCLSLQKPEWHVAFDDDKLKAVTTRQRILEMTANEKIPVIGYHMPFPGIGFVKKLGSKYIWIPASYQFFV